MDLYAVAERENLDVGRVFLMAQRLYKPHHSGASADYQRWLEGGAVPEYVQQFAHYSDTLARTETTGRRKFA